MRKRTALTILQIGSRIINFQLFNTIIKANSHKKSQSSYIFVISLSRSAITSLRKRGVYSSCLASWSIISRTMLQCTLSHSILCRSPSANSSSFTSSSCSCRKRNLRMRKGHCLIKYSPRDVLSISLRLSDDSVEVTIARANLKQIASSKR